MRRMLASLFGVMLTLAVVPAMAFAEAPADAGGGGSGAAAQGVAETAAEVIAEGDLGDGEAASTAELSDEDAEALAAGGTLAAGEALAADADIAGAEAAASAIEAQAASQIVNEGGTSSGIAEDGTAITVGKTIEGTGIENYFDITLTVEVGETEQDNSTAVIIVMDISNTMNEAESAASGTGAGATRLQNAQAAANEFVRQYCEGEGLSPNRLFGLITFNTNAQWADGLALQVVQADSVAALQASINAITAPATPSGVRFTNMEAGLRLAYNALASLNVAHKYVIFVTDGFPTTYIDRSISGNLDSTDGIAGYDPYEPGAYRPADAGTDGYFADAVLGLPCTYGTSYSDKAAARAAEIAALMKAGNAETNSAGINIFSVGIDIGAQTIAYYVSRATSTFSIVDRVSDTYVIDSATDASAYSDWLANAIAGGPSLTDAASKYANGDNAAELSAAFANILADIKATTGMPLASALVVDPMGKDIEFQHFFDASGSPAGQLTGSFGESSAESPLGNTASFAEDGATITWNLRESGYTVTLNDDGTRTYAYALTYRVRLMNEAAGFGYGEEVLTNGTTELEYATLDAEGNLAEGEPVAFPSPSVRGFAGELAFDKVDSVTGIPVEGAVFELRHSDACPVCAAAAAESGGLGAPVVVVVQQQVSNAGGAVVFAGIPSGHEYVLVEAQPAEGYFPNTAEYSVAVTYGVTTAVDEVGRIVFEAGDDEAGFLVKNDPVNPPVVPEEPANPTNPGIIPAAYAAGTTGALSQTGDALLPLTLALLAMAVFVVMLAAFARARRR